MRACRVGGIYLLFILFLCTMVNIAGCGGGSGSSSPASYGGGDSITVVQPARTYVVSGTLKDSISGAPVPSATCSLLPYSRNNYFSRFEVTAKSREAARTCMTDCQGHYSFAGVPQGSYTIRFECQGYIAATEHGIPVTGDMANLDRTMQSIQGWAQVYGTTHPYDPARYYVVVTVDSLQKKAPRLAGMVASISPSDGVQIGYMTDGTPPVVDWSATATWANGQVFFGNLTPGVAYTITFTNPETGATGQVLVSSPSAPGEITYYDVIVEAPVNPYPTPRGPPRQRPLPRPPSPPPRPRSPPRCPLTR